MAPTISLGRYLFERLNQSPLGINTIFGVPGDYNLTLLDKIYEVEDLKWAGNANELNAAYAADGYSRVKRLACLVTTFGVGELSALNGIAGSYAEHVGVVHVVGVPATSSQKKHLLLHHTLGNGDFTVFEKMSRPISQTTAALATNINNPDEIDRVIREAYVHQRPTYLAFPANLVDLEVPAERLNTPLDLLIPPNDTEAQDEVIERVVDLIKNSKNPVILVDACCARHDATLEARQLIELTGFKYAITPMAKGVAHIDEDDEKFAGVYVGSLSYPGVKLEVESADLILSLGAMLSDFNTGSFSYSYLTKNVVEFHSSSTKIRAALYENVSMKEVLHKLANNSKLKEIVKSFQTQIPKKDDFSIVKHNKKETIEQEWLWSKLSSWLRSGDIVVTETGTSSFGIIQTHFPKNVMGISQILWGSIGYSVGATLGAVVAAQEIDPKRRVILFVGDGSLQLTVQEISTMIKLGTKPYLFILNNNGYTIERLIHGETAEYNEIKDWDHKKILETFKAKEFEAKTVEKAAELEDLFDSEKFATNDKIRLVEIMLETLDAPANLVKQAKLSSAANAEN